MAKFIIEVMEETTNVEAIEVSIADGLNAISALVNHIAEKMQEHDIPEEVIKDLFEKATEVKGA